MNGRLLAGLCLAQGHALLKPGIVLDDWNEGIQCVTCAWIFERFDCLSEQEQTNERNPSRNTEGVSPSAACMYQCVFIYFHNLFIPPASCAPPPTIYHCPERAPSLLCSSSEPASDYRSGLILPGRVTSWADLEIIAGNGTDLCMYSNKYHYGFELLNIFANKF